MRKIYAIAAFLLLGAAAMQAQPVAHQAGVAKGNEFKAEMMEPENAGDAVVATEAERAAMSLKAAPATGEAYYYRPAGTFFVGTAATTTYSQFAPYLVVSPYKSYTFKAQEAESYAWRFQIGNNWYELASRNVNAKYNFESDSVPSLTVGETEYHVFGNKSESEPKSNYSRLYAVPRPADYFGNANTGPYYASPKYFAYRDRDNTGGGTRYFTGSTIGYDGGTGYWFGFNTNGWNGMATYVEEPQNPYLINGGAIRYSNLAFVDATASNNVPIYIDVYSVTSHTDQTLELGEKLATATAYLTNDTPASGGMTTRHSRASLSRWLATAGTRDTDSMATCLKWVKMAFPHKLWALATSSLTPIWALPHPPSCLMWSLPSCAITTAIQSTPLWSSLRQVSA